MLNHALDSFDGGDGKLLCFEVARGEPVAINQPVHTNAALVGNDGGSLGSLLVVEFDGGDACHKTGKARHAVKTHLASWGCSDAVSYTHLDVYKRQGQSDVWPEPRSIFPLMNSARMLR